MMPTTSAAAARDILTALKAAQIEFALLHEMGGFATESISDVDVAVGRLNAAIVDRLLDTTFQIGYSPLAVWHYDVRAVNIFFVNEDLSEGVQLDLLADPAGLSRYGIRTLEVVYASYLQNGVPKADPLDSWLYQISKRWLKQQKARLAALLAAPPDHHKTAQARASLLFRPDRAAQVRRLLIGEDPRPRHPVPWYAGSAARALSRLRHPCGVWIHAGGWDAGAAAARSAELLDRILVHASATETSAANVPKRLGIFGPHGTDRWRPTAHLTYGASPIGRPANGLNWSKHIPSLAARSRTRLMHLAKLNDAD